VAFLFAVLFVYLPIRDGADGFMGPVRLNALVFIPLAVVTGVAFLIGGLPVLEAFQVRPKSRGQNTLVLPDHHRLRGVDRARVLAAQDPVVAPTGTGDSRWLSADDRSCHRSCDRIPGLDSNEPPSGQPTSAGGDLVRHTLRVK
jgi:hypothetical protein